VLSWNRRLDRTISNRSLKSPSKIGAGQQSRFRISLWHVLFSCSRYRVAGALKSRDWTTRHQIKQIATGSTSVGPIKNRTRWTISELTAVCHDSTAALIVACSFCVQSAILSALIRSPYSRGSTTAATATAAKTKTRTGMAPVPATPTLGASESATALGSRGNNLGRLLQSVHRGAIRVGIALVPCGHRTRRQMTQWWQRKLIEIDLSIGAEPTGATGHLPRYFSKYRGKHIFMPRYFFGQ